MAVLSWDTGIASSLIRGKIASEIWDYFFQPILPGRDVSKRRTLSPRRSFEWMLPGSEERRVDPPPFTRLLPEIQFSQGNSPSGLVLQLSLSRS